MARKRIYRGHIRKRKTQAQRIYRIRKKQIKEKSEYALLLSECEAIKKENAEIKADLESLCADLAKVEKYVKEMHYKAR